jgi:hypothetical protein
VATEVLRGHRLSILARGRREPWLRAWLSLYQAALRWGLYSKKILTMFNFKIAAARYQQCRGWWGRGFVGWVIEFTDGKKAYCSR